MKILLQIFTISLLITCGTKSTSEQTSMSPKSAEPIVKNSRIEKDSIVVTEIVDGINFFNYGLRRWNGNNWDYYINTGDPDTAVTLYAYKLLTSYDEPDYSDWASFTNLYKKTTVVKSIIQNKFSTENSIDLIFEGIDELNKKFVDYAKNQVQSDMKKYGKSDGPYYDLLQQIKK